MSGVISSFSWLVVYWTLNEDKLPRCNNIPAKLALYSGVSLGAWVFNLMISILFPFKYAVCMNEYVKAMKSPNRYTYMIWNISLLHFFQALFFCLHFIAEIQFLALIQLIDHWRRQQYQRIEGTTHEEFRTTSMADTPLLIAAVIWARNFLLVKHEANIQCVRRTVKKFG